MTSITLNTTPAFFGEWHWNNDREEQFDEFEREQETREPKLEGFLMRIKQVFQGK